MNILDSVEWEELLSISNSLDAAATVDLDGYRATVLRRMDDGAVHLKIVHVWQGSSRSIKWSFFIPKQHQGALAALIRAQHQDMTDAYKSLPKHLK